MNVLWQTDEETVYIHDRAGKVMGWFYLVYGNDGYDLISDFSDNAASNGLEHRHLAAGRQGGGRRMNEDKFSVVQFFEDDSYEYVRTGVGAEEAVKAAHHYCHSVGATLGITKRVNHPFGRLRGLRMEAR